MITSLTNFAEVAASNNMFASLGIDWKMLILQGVAFIVFVIVMAKWVMPPLVKAVDDRQNKIEESTKAAESAEKNAKKAEENIERQLATARKDAAEILATAHDEAVATLEKAQTKAKESAEHIAKNAHDQIEKDIVAARETLRKDTVELVALATEKVVGATVTKSVDSKLIEKSLEEVK